jgi:hypothetical protein
MGRCSIACSSDASVTLLQDFEEQLGALESMPYFLPLFNTTVNHPNLPMLDYFQANILETVEVSDIAKWHINYLKGQGIDPSDWRDDINRPVLVVAVTNNYIKLAQWLVDQGVPVTDRPGYRYALSCLKTSCVFACLS